MGGDGGHRNDGMTLSANTSLLPPHLMLAVLVVISYCTRLCLRAASASARRRASSAAARSASLCMPPGPIGTPPGPRFGRACSCKCAERVGSGEGD